MGVEPIPETTPTISFSSLSSPRTVSLHGAGLFLGAPGDNGPAAMSARIELPLWMVLALVLLAGWATLDRVLVPSVRWYLRRRLNRVIDELNTRLKIGIQPFQRTRRQVLIDRLLYDPLVLEAAAAAARDRQMPREVVLADVERHAREIVPAFNAYFYFRLGTWISRRAARLLYRVRLGASDEAALAAVPAESTVVFLMNHRSNMDYVLVAYLAADRTALSYAVGEWARIWPLQTLIRATGAYFVRRSSGDPLYRRVLERYIQMATAAGVTQAVYPEGGLTRDGRLRPPKLGLLGYMLRTFDPGGERDLVFIPVGINYDRTLEDRTLLLDVVPRPRVAGATVTAAAGTAAPGVAAAGPAPPGTAAAGATGAAAAEATAREAGTGPGTTAARAEAGAALRPGPARAVGIALGFALRQGWLMARNRWHRFGYACVTFGAPISMRRYLGERQLDFRTLAPAEHSARLAALGADLMAAVGAVVPVLPVPLVASVFVERVERTAGQGGDQAIDGRQAIDGAARADLADREPGALSLLELKVAAWQRTAALEAAGARVYVPRRDQDYAIEAGLRVLTQRHLVEERDGLYSARPQELPLLRYYANSIAHLAPGASEADPPVAAPAHRDTPGRSVAAPASRDTPSTSAGESTSAGTPGRSQLAVAPAVSSD
jgi:glycerol-3-phosphate O-acyltransferase